MEEFFNLRQAGMIIQEYSLKFIKLSKYAPSLVSIPRGKMSHFLGGLFDDLMERCCSATLHENMEISRLMVNSQQV